MKYYLYTLCLMLSGCTTSVVTGKKKLLGIISIPFTGDPEKTADPKLAALIEQLAPLVWVSIPLIIVGAYWWWVTQGRTGLGKLSVGLGSVFLAVAIILPQIIGWVALITVIAVVSILVYFVYTFFVNKDKDTLDKDTT